MELCPVTIPKFHRSNTPFLSNSPEAVHRTMVESGLCASFRDFITEPFSPILEQESRRLRHDRTTHGFHAAGRGKTCPLQ